MTADLEAVTHTLAKRADTLIEFFDLHTRSHWSDDNGWWWIACGCHWRGTDGHLNPAQWLAHRRDALRAVLAPIPDDRLAEAQDEDSREPFVGSMRVMDALLAVFTDHIYMSETPDDGPGYLWCACGWRSDQAGGTEEAAGRFLRTHMANEAHAALVPVIDALMSDRLAEAEAKVRRVEALAKPTCGVVTTATLRAALSGGDAT